MRLEDNDNFFTVTKLVAGEGGGVIYHKGS